MGEPTDPLLTVSQLAEKEGVPEWKIRDWLRAPTPLPSYRCGGVRVRLSEYRAWMEARRRG